MSIYFEAVAWRQEQGIAVSAGRQAGLPSVQRRMTGAFPTEDCGHQHGYFIQDESAE